MGTIKLKKQVKNLKQTADADFGEEIKELRTENETVYRSNDKTCRKIITAAPTRFRDENGELKDIKNKLTDNGTEIVNSESHYNIRFDKDAHSGKIFELQKGKNVLTLSSTDLAKASGHNCGCACKLCSGKDNTVSVTLHDGTEVQYEAMNDRIKENIIVKGRQEKYEYNFTLNVGNLTVEEGKNNDLLLKDIKTGTTEFRIPAPFMYDADKNYSNKVSYEIDVNGNELAIKVIADADFINAEGRAFPVTIDPQILTFEDGVFSFSSTENYEKSDSDAQNWYDNILRVEYNSRTEYFATIRIDCSRLPEYSSDNNYYLRVVAKKNSYGSFIASGEINIRTAVDGGIYVINISNSYKLANKRGYIWIQLSGKDEDMHAEFFTGGEFAPMLIIAGKDENSEFLKEGKVDLNSNNELLAKHYYKTLALPDGVAFMTDLYTRKSLVSICDAPAEKSLMNLSIQHIHKGGTENIGYGTGFRLNIEEFIKEENGKEYYYDALGNKYWIKGEGLIVRDLIYTSTVPASVKELYAYTKGVVKPVKWIYSGNMVKGFDYKGNLVMINDSCKNCIAIRRYSTGQIMMLEKYHGDSYLARINFQYESLDTNIYAINFGNREGVQFNYNDNGDIISLYYTSGKTLYFSYDSNGNISQISSSDGYSSLMEYGDASVKVTVKSTKTEVPNGSTSNSLPEIKSDTIEFKDRLTIVNGEEYYDFNENGILIAYTREKNSVVVQAERYEDTPNYLYKVIKASNLSSNQDSYNRYSFVAGETTSIAYNIFGQPIRVGVTNTPIKYGTFADTVTTYNYEYDEDKKVNLCVSEVTELTYKIGFNTKTFKVITEYKYDSTTNLVVKKAVYTEGEQDTLGKSIKEYEYDSQGNCTKTTSYNNIGNTAKFITERTFDEYGRVKSQTDPVGNYSAIYNYIKDTQLISDISYSDGAGEVYKYSQNRLNEVTFNNSADSNPTNAISYSDGEVIGYSDGSNAIELSYDSKRRINQITVGGIITESIAYGEETLEDKSAKYAEVTYGNGAKYKSVVTKDGSLIKTYSGAKEGYRAEFNLDGSISKENDYVTNEEVNYTYDSLGILALETTKKDGVVSQSTQYGYDDYGMLIGTRSSGNDCGNVIKRYFYTDDSARRLAKETTQGKITVLYEYNKLGMITGKTIQGDTTTTVDSQTFAYNNLSSATISCPSSILYKDGEVIVYGYNSNGNISTINTNNESYRYTYDTLGRLTEEHNSRFGFSKYYSYDSYGNIVKVTQCEYDSKQIVSEKDYKYLNGRLNSYDGKQCVYDSIGNPINYRGYSAVWKGRQLTKFKGTVFAYDGRGRRISKGNITFTYDHAGNLIKQKDVLEFFYDCQGVAGFKYQSTLFYYRKDAQGNIIAILDKSGNVLVKYYYDAWGNHKWDGNSTLANLNPFRYRGYYYDRETGLYYLQTRYYDPEVGRFISQDNTDFADPETVNGLNLYAYCLNNPVNYIDIDGTFAITITAMAAAAAAAALLALLVVENTYHPIQNAFDELGNYISENIDNIIDNIFNQTGNNSTLPDAYPNYNDTSIAIPDFGSLIYLQYDPDPYKRPGQHKQGNELKNKSRQKPGWEQRNGYRRGPKPPKHHTPGRDHRRHFIIYLLEYLF